MNQELHEQARTIHETIHVLKSLLLTRFNGNGCCAKAGEGHPDITMPQMHCLMAIRERGSVSIKELAQALAISPPSASAMVDRLVETGAVTREPSPVDRRGVIVSVSEEGSKAIEGLESIILRGIEELLVKIGPEYAKKWYEVYKRIAEVLQEDEGIVSGDMLEPAKGNMR